MQTIPFSKLILSILISLVLFCGKNPARGSEDPMGSPPALLQFRADVVKEDPPSGARGESRLPILNALIVQIIATMPKGGGYSIGRVAFSNLGSAIDVDPRAQMLTLRPERAIPSFCSGATYLLFLKAVTTLIDDRELSLPSEAIAALKVAGQPDGVGIWGRWDANGPGTAKLFHDLNIGTNFVGFARAQPGDFMKIWWNDFIGSKEKGHSVIFLGLSHGKDGVDMVRFWSSNQGIGFGEKSIPKSKIVRALFSRFDNPKELVNAHRLPRMDSYLKEMLTRTSTEGEMFERCGVKATPGASLAPPPKAIAVETAPPSAAVDRVWPVDSATQHSRKAPSPPSSGASP